MFAHGRRLDADALVFSALVVSLATPASAALTRQEAVDALLAPGSGVPADTSTVPIWSPFADYGFGAGFEGLLAESTIVDPGVFDDDSLSVPRTTLDRDAYFFWIDDLPGALFEHPVRFVLLDANDPAPTVMNGGIQLYDRGWWPVLTFIDGTSDTLYEAQEDRVTAQPPAFDNPDGLVAGPANHPADIQPWYPPALASPPRPATRSSNACALIINGGKGQAFRNDVAQFENDLVNHYGVGMGRIVKANDGEQASASDIADAIQALCQLDPDCDKIYLRITSHGRGGPNYGILVRGGLLTKKKLCREMQKVAAKGVPICAIFNFCHAAGNMDVHHWNFPAGSSLIFVAAADKCGLGDATFEDSDGEGKVTGSLYPHAFGRCLADSDADADQDGIVDECEAHEWVLAQKPCYPWVKDNIPRYPAGPPDGKDGESPGPSKVRIGADPYSINLNVCNATGEPKTDFHFIFKGDVRGGYGGAWRSNENDEVDGTWASLGMTVTYDESTGETMVCWENADDPIAAGDYVHVGYQHDTKKLKPVRQYWTPESGRTADLNKVPTWEASALLSEDHSTLEVRAVARQDSSDGWGEPVLVEPWYRVAPDTIPLAELNLGSPLVQSLPPVAMPPLLLVPDVPVTFSLAVPLDIAEGQVLILESHASWVLNGNTTIRLAQFDPLTGAGVVGVGSETEPAPRFLVRSYPNPFTRGVTLGYQLAAPARVWLSVYDVSGRLVRTLVAGRREPSGERSATWDGADGDGRLLPPGIYLYRLDADGRVGTGKMALVR